MEIDIQKYFVELLKKSQPVHLNIAEEIAGVLKISADSAYRRLRCDTEFSLNEAVRLCEHFGISLESLSDQAEHIVSFNFHNLQAGSEKFTHYLEALSKDTQWLSGFQEANIYYAAEDIPMLYNLYYPGLAAFKMSYWNKSILNDVGMQGLKMEEMAIPDTWKKLGEQIARSFLQIGSVEIWNNETISGSLQQIRFYWEAGFFAHKETALGILRELRQLVMDINRQAEIGKKINPLNGNVCDAAYTLYVTDLRIGNNFVFLKAEQKEASYLAYNTFNYMRTTNLHFNAQALSWLQNLIAKSTLVSQVAEKQRNQFFKHNLLRISELEKFIHDDV